PDDAPPPDYAPPPDAPPPDAPPPDAPPAVVPAPAEEWPAVRIRRPRAPRTVLTAVVVTCVLVAAGAVLYDAVAARTGHPARQWRATLEQELADRQLQDLPVLIGAGIAAVVGIVLCWAAFAPGLRHWLPLRRPGAVVHRDAVGTLVRTRAADLPGVERCKVRVRRHRAKAVITGSAEPAEVQRALRAELARVPLAGAYRLDVRTRPGRPAQPHDRRHGHGRLAQEASR
ncbi:DUF6286 domain-containing protein, partial [Kitasatospora paranensis]